MYEYMEAKPNLPDLPNNDDEFWEGAEKYINKPEAVNSDGPHYFELVRGKEGYCGHCGWGFLLDKGDEVKEGHVYDGEGHLVI